MGSLRPPWRLRRAAFSLIVIAFFVVAFGQPAWVPILGLLAAVCGYALFWKGMLAFKRASTRFWLSTTWFGAVQLVQLSWMTSDEYQGAFIWAVWLILALICGLQFGVLSFLVRPVLKLTLLRIVAVPSVWVLFEWSRLFLTAGFTWNPVGLALTGALVPAQLVAVAGVYGLSFWVMLANILFLQLLVAPRLYHRWSWAICMAALPYLFGMIHLWLHSERLERAIDPPLTAVLVQTGLGPAEKGSLGLWHPDSIGPQEQWVRILSLLSEHQEREVDLIVLPEGALPLDAYSPLSCGNETVSNATLCHAVADTLGADLIVGLNSHNDASGEQYNAALHFQPGKEEVEQYVKRVLLPFAESIPYGWMKTIASRYGIVGSFTAGRKPTVFAAPVPAGVTICYEETFGNLVRESRQLGAELLVNLSTDGWYPDSKLPEQHFTHGRLRAIENGVPLIRACHTGITAAVDCLGRTIGQVGDRHGRPEGLAKALLVEIPRYHYRTLYARYGDGPIVGLSLLLAILALRQRSGIAR